MSILMLSVIQFIIQLFLYKQIISDILLLLVIKYLEFSNNTRVAIKIYKILLLGANILISILVRYFTNSGYMSGISNLFASVLLGFVMAFDVFRLKSKLKN